MHEPSTEGTEENEKKKKRPYGRPPHDAAAVSAKYSPALIAMKLTRALAHLTRQNEKKKIYVCESIILKSC